MGLFYISSSNSGQRFDMSNFMEYTDNYDSITSEFFRELKNIQPVGKYEVQNEENRPDALSYKIYGDTQYWWILLFYNDKLTNEDIKNGDMISYPSINDLEILYFSLKSRERTA